MATFAELQTRVQEIIIDLPTPVLNRVPTLVNEAVRKLQTLHDFKVCEALSSVFTTTLDTRVLGAVPADFVKFRGRPHMITNQGRVIEIGVASDRPAVEREFGSTAGGEFVAGTLRGRPRVLLQSENTDEAGASNFEVYPLPDGLSLYTTAPAGEYRIRVPYWKFLTVLSGSGDQNWFTNNAEEWIVHKAASRGFVLDWDEAKAAVQQGLAQNEWVEIKRRDKLMRVGALRELRVSPDARGPRVDGGDTGNGWGSGV